MRGTPRARGVVEPSPSHGASWAPLFITIVIPLSRLIATGKPLPLTETAISALTGTASFGYCRSCEAFRRRPPGPSRDFESQAGKPGFRVSRLLLLGGRPPDFDQLFQHLAAVAQAMALLKLIEICDGLARQIGEELKTAF